MTCRVLVLCLLAAWSSVSLDAQARVRLRMLAASEYYVSTSGNDTTGVGSAGNPWRTVQKCADTMNVGGRCYVAAGTYAENVTLSRSGSPGVLFTFISTVAHGAVVQKFTISGSYVAVHDFTVSLLDGSQFGVSITGDVVALDGNHLTTASTALGLNNNALQVTGDGNTINANLVDQTCFGMSIAGDNNLVTANEITLLRHNGTCSDIDYLRFFGSGHIFRNNNFHGIVLADVGAAHVDCYQTFDNATSSFDVLIEQNFCGDSHQGVLVSADTSNLSSGMIIRNNVFSGTTAFCISNSNVADMHILNNTCDVANQYGFICRGLAGTASCEFKNNILYNTATAFAYGSIEAATYIDGAAGEPGENNLIYKPAGTVTGYADDILNVDPLFTNQGSRDYTLQSGSPALNVAQTLVSFSTDKIGVVRPQGAGWDIGAYERIP